MRLRLLAVLLMVSAAAAASNVAMHTVWKIGESDNSARELALGPDGYSKFLEHDFGYEDRYFLVGRSVPSKDFPYILPGPDDRWGGTSGTAGLRTHEVNILFALQTVGAKDKARLVVDLAGVNARRAAVKVTVNGRSARYDLNGTSDSAAYGRQTAADERVVELPLTADDLRCGGNSVTITVLEGSWIVFDHVRLEATRGVKMASLHRDFFVRSVAAAPYELLRDGVRVQPLLVDTRCSGVVARSA